MKLKVIKGIGGIVGRKKGDVVNYVPWSGDWQGSSEPERVANGVFVHCYGQGEFEVFRLGVDVELLP